MTRDIDDPNYNDTNMGEGAYRDTPEEKEIKRLTSQLSEAREQNAMLKGGSDLLAQERDEARRERDELLKRMSHMPREDYERNIQQAEERGARSAFEYKRRRYEAHNETVLQRMVDADMTEWRKRNGKGGGE